jgi:hypothetical protein
MPITIKAWVISVHILSLALIIIPFTFGSHAAKIAAININNVICSPSCSPPKIQKRSKLVYNQLRLLSAEREGNVLDLQYVGYQILVGLGRVTA